MVEPLILAEVTKLIGTPESLQYILMKVEKYVSEIFSTVPQEIKLKEAEVINLNKALQRLVQEIMKGHSSNSDRCHNGY